MTTKLSSPSDAQNSVETTEPSHVTHWNGERILAILFLALCTIYGLGTFSFMESSESDVVGPATFPRLIAVLGVVCAATFLVLSRHGRAESEGISEKHLLSDLKPLGLTLIYVIAFEPLGYTLSTFLYLTIGIRMLGKSWRYAAGASAFSTILFYLAFSVGLSAHLPDGLIPLNQLLALL